jgi:hypothetical protein
MNAQRIDERRVSFAAQDAFSASKFAESRLIDIEFIDYRAKEERNIGEFGGDVGPSGGIGKPPSFQ